MIAPTAAPVIDCSEISHRFGSKQALIDVSFSVNKGQIAALVGWIARRIDILQTTSLYPSRLESVFLRQTGCSRSESPGCRKDA